MRASRPPDRGQLSDLMQYWHADRVPGNATRYPVTIARGMSARNRPGRSPGKIARADPRADPRVRGSENFNVQLDTGRPVHEPRIDARDSRAVRLRDRPPARGRHI